MTTTSTLPSLVQSFFMDRLMQQRQASPHTIASYRDTFRLLLQFAAAAAGQVADEPDGARSRHPLLGAFLDHLGTRSQEQRPQSQCAPGGESIHSSLRWRCMRREHSSVAQRVLAMPSSATRGVPIAFSLRRRSGRILAAPNLRHGQTARPGHVMLAVQTGLRARSSSGLAATTSFLAWAPCPLRGKGRKRRCTPLSKDIVECCATGCASEAVSPPIRSSRACEAPPESRRACETCSTSMLLLRVGGARHWHASALPACASAHAGHGPAPSRRRPNRDRSPGSDTSRLSHASTCTPTCS